MQRQSLVGGTSWAKTAVLCILALTAGPTAQSGWSRDCDTPGLGVGGRVFAVGTWNNELIAGTYRTPSQDGVTIPHIGRYDGVRWRPLGAGVDDAVRAICEFQGELYIAGEFRWSGSTATVGVARWDGSAWRPVGAGLDGRVWALCEHQGQLIAVGEFQRSGTRVVGSIARYDGVAWQSVGNASYANLGVPAVYCALSDGPNLYVGGEFTAIDGVAASHLARWNGSGWSGVGGGLNSFGYGAVRALASYRGRLIVGGAFGVAGSVTVDDVAAWDGQNWSRLGPDLSNQVYGSDVRSLKVYGSDLYIGGSFNVLGGATPVHRIVRYDGQALHPVGGATHAEANPATIFAMTEWGGELYCGGEFEGVLQPGTSSGPSTAVYHIASFDGARWARLGSGDWGLNAEAKTLGWWRGRRVIGGRMTFAGDAMVTGLGVFDGQSWHGLSTFDGVVWDMVEHLGDLWVVGEFRTVNGLTVNGVARYDGTQWHSLAGGPNLSGCYGIAVYQGRIHVGTVGSPVVWTGTAWQRFAPNVFGTITDLHVHNGLLYLGGSTPFTTGSPNLFQWDGSTLSVVGGGTNGSVEALGSFGPDLVVGGRFTAAGGQAMQHITLWDGQSFRAIGGGLAGSTVADFEVFQGQLVACGDIRLPGGRGDYVVRFDGRSWQGMPGGSPDGFVSALLADDQRGELHVAGWYHSVGGLPSPNYSIWHARLPWQDVGLGLTSGRRAPFLQAFGEFTAGDTLHLTVSSAPESAQVGIVFGTRRVDSPLLGGTLVPNGDLAFVARQTDVVGVARLDLTWMQLTPGFEVHTQAWCLDASMPMGVSSTNGVTLRQP